MAQEISISIEETNKLRIQLGLKPLVIQAEEKVYDKSQFIERPSRLKSKLDLARRRAVEPVVEDDDDDWLSRVGKKKVGTKVDEKVDSEELDLKVGHDFDSLEQGENIVLTLKDKDILDDEEDELVNEKLVQQQEDDKRVREKLGKDKYKQVDGWEEEKSLMEKYQERLEGESKPFFRTVTGKQSKPKENKFAGKRRLSFSDEEEEEVSDYVKMKKLKKPKSKGRVRDPNERIEIKHVKLVDMDGDDDGLDRVLSKQRMQSLKRAKPLSPEELAREVLEAQVEKEERGERVGLVVDGSSDFFDGVKSALEARSVVEEVAQTAATITTAATPLARSASPTPITINSEQTSPTFSGGIADALKLLHAVPSNSDKEQREAKKHSDLIKFKQELEAKRIHSEISGKMKDQEYTEEELQKIREYEQDQIAKVNNQLQRERLENYKPVINIKYHDDKGKEMSSREAYKQLSRAFHGFKGKKK